MKTKTDYVPLVEGQRIQATDECEIFPGTWFPVSEASLGETYDRSGNPCHKPMRRPTLKEGTSALPPTLNEQHGPAGLH
jgi:hypothetical protein